jgi:peptidoglycan/xylan/chitin deacetylase (PgdA/CDA1 family)
MNGYRVLLFHSIEGRDLLSLKDLGNIRPKLFEKLIVSLRKEFDIISLDELVRCISGNLKPKDRLLALTFDDGPKSYMTQALPVMEVYDVSSTCFLITDCIGDVSLYWRYFYNYCIHRGCAQQLADFINDEYDASIGTEEIVSFSRCRYDKQKTRRIIEKLLDGVVPEEEYRNTENDLFLSLEDIGSLKINPLIRFGIHTRSHAVLRCLSDEDIRDEIGGCRDFYQRCIGDGSPFFSIPFGRLFRDYDERTIMIAQSLGVEVILSAYGGGNEEGQPLYNIRRISVNEGNLAAGIGTFVKALREAAMPPEYLEKEKRLSKLVFGT